MQAKSTVSCALASVDFNFVSGRVTWWTIVMSVLVEGQPGGFIAVAKLTDGRCV